MSAFEIVGGKQLAGEIRPQGAKNEALQILCATLLSPDEITIHNIPDIRDVNVLIDLLRELGVKIKRISESSYTFQADQVDIDYLKTPEYSSKASRIRGSVMMLGPLLARFKIGYLPQPGGDKIGRRRLDTHFVGLQKLGAKFSYNHSERFYQIEASSLKGTYMLLDEASVTGTANIVMAATMASGTTTIFNAA